MGLAVTQLLHGVTTVGRMLRAAFMKTHMPGAWFRCDVTVRLFCMPFVASQITVIPQNHEYVFKTKRKIPRCGVMFVGWGGNNGTTVTGGRLT